MATSATMRRLAPRWVPAPHVGYLLVSFRCNLRCTSCGAWEVTGHDDLDTERWRAIFTQLRSLDIIKFLGGEPFARSDMGELMAEARRVIDPYIMQLTTNGTLTEPIVEAIGQVGWPGLQLRVSLDGLEETHDRQRGLPGSWARATATLRALAPLRQRLGFKLGINYALTDDSIGEADRMMALAASLGADLIPGVNVTPFLDGSSTPSETPQRFIMLQDPKRALRVLADKRAGTRSQLPRLDHLVSRLVTGDVFRKEIEQGSLRFRCRSLRDILYVLPQGRVVLCGVDHWQAGDLSRMSVAEIWRSRRAERGRQRVDACPGCLQASMHIMSRLYGGSLLC